MRNRDRDMQIMDRLASMPFVDRLELAALCDTHYRSLYNAMARLEREGMAQSVPHATETIAPTRRYCLTAAGLQRLAHYTGVDIDELLGARPVSAQWQRILLQRLDAVAVIYRLAADIARKVGPVRVRWYRRGPLDVGLLLPDGRTVGVVRQGLTSDRTGFAKRLWRLRQASLAGAVLVLVPDEVRLRHARRLLTRTPMSAFLAVERDAVLAGEDERIWRLPSVNASLDLGHVVSYIEGRSGLPAAPPSLRTTLPDDLELADSMLTAPDHLLPALLKPMQKRALDLVHDWPWITSEDLSGLLGVSRARLWQVVAPLVSAGLVCRASTRGRLLVLSDQGLGVLARRDRTSVRIARKRWSPSLVHPETPFEWRNVVGRRGRQLLRHLEHTAAVHEFIAAMARQARQRGWTLAQVDPPMRASRYFRHGGQLHSIHPDAFGVLRGDGKTWPFFLEWERRAVRPSTMAERLAPYLRYYSSHRPTDDHGVQPDVLVVFREDTPEGHFLRMAQEQMQRVSVRVPMAASHYNAVERFGPLGAVWRIPAANSSIPSSIRAAPLSDL